MAAWTYQNMDLTTTNATLPDISCHTCDFVADPDNVGDVTLYYQETATKVDILAPGENFVLESLRNTNTFSAVSSAASGDALFLRALAGGHRA